jgi:hypothetical protein
MTGPLPVSSISSMLTGALGPLAPPQRGEAIADASDARDMLLRNRERGMRHDPWMVEGSAGTPPDSSILNKPLLKVARRSRQVELRMNCQVEIPV